ncbi:hypothetical protein FRX31_026095, partial [Thalictrum thalictroides]
MTGPGTYLARLSSLLRPFTANKKTSDDNLLLLYSVPPPFPFDLVWSVSMSSKIKFFIFFCALQGRIQTLEHLTKRGMQLQNLCTFCKQQPECINHLFLYCVVSQSILIELVDLSIDSINMLSRSHSLEELLNRWPRHNS